jgi:hypothetical protein
MWSTFISKNSSASSTNVRAVVSETRFPSRKAVLDQRDRQGQARHLGRDQVEAEPAHDGDRLGAGVARERHRVGQQRLAADGDQRLGELLGQRPEAASQARRQQYGLHGGSLT